MISYISENILPNFKLKLLTMLLIGLALETALYFSWIAPKTDMLTLLKSQEFTLKKQYAVKLQQTTTLPTLQKETLKLESLYRNTQNLIAFKNKTFAVAYIKRLAKRYRVKIEKMSLDNNKMILQLSQKKPILKRFLTHLFRIKKLLVFDKLQYEKHKDGFLLKTTFRFFVKNGTSQ